MTFDHVHVFLPNDITVPVLLQYYLFQNFHIYLQMYSDWSWNDSATIWIIVKCHKTNH